MPAFTDGREDNYLYVDKTALIHEFISTGKIYFFNRPRRFDKSLLISRFDALFSGRKALFEGLAIASTDCDYDFSVHPVIALQTKDKIYIIEFKLNDSKEAALQQIHDKRYAQKYQNSDKSIVQLFRLVQGYKSFKFRTMQARCYTLVITLI